MERTKYFNNTIPTETQLGWTESSRSRSILRRQDATAQMGIVSGFQITINSADSSKIDIAAGTAYTGGKFKQTEVTGDGIGERISTLTTSASGGNLSGSYIVQGLGLASYSNGESNYVVVKYTEEDTVPLSEVDYPFTQHKTIVSEKYTTEVYRQSDYNALTNEEKQIRVLVGIVVARGAGVALSLADVTQVVQPRTHPTATAPSTVTGVTIEAISDETPFGTATLRYESSTKKLYWTAPGDTEGIGVAPTSSGILNLTSANTLYTASLSIVYGNLPSADASDNITIQTLYGSIIPRYSANDSLHRDMKGTGILSANNPHALSLDDITGGTFDHADDFHLNGIAVTADSTQLQCQIDVIDDRIEITNIGGSENKFLIDGITYETIENVAAGTDAIVPFDTSPTTATGDYLIYLDSSAGQNKVSLSDTALWDTDIYIVDMLNRQAGNCTITWDDSDGTLTYQAAGDAETGDAVTVLEDTSGNPIGYYKLYSSNSDNWVIVRCVGALGAANSTTFATAMNVNDHPEERILKLAVVNWDLPTEVLSNLRDIRQYATADDKKMLLEEHDSDGAHTIPLRNTFRVGVESGPAIHGRAVSVTGVYGVASASIGVFGSAAGVEGVSGTASRVGVHGVASNTGVRGYASEYGGVLGIAASSTGVYGSAESKGIVGTASQNIAGSFKIDFSSDGVYRTALIATANNDGVKEFAYGVYGMATCTGGTAVFASGGKVGCWADGSTGVYASAGAAASTAAIFSADDSITYAISAYGYLAFSAGTNAGKAGADEYLPVKVNGNVRWLQLHTTP